MLWLARFPPMEKRLYPHHGIKHSNYGMPSVVMNYSPCKDTKKYSLIVITHRMADMLFLPRTIIT